MRLHVALDTTTKDLYQHFSVLKRMNNGIMQVLYIGNLWDWITESDVARKYQYHDIKQIITRHKHPIFII